VPSKNERGKERRKDRREPIGAMLPRTTYEFLLLSFPRSQTGDLATASRGARLRLRGASSRPSEGKTMNNYDYVYVFFLAPLSRESPVTRSSTSSSLYCTSLHALTLLG